MDEQQSSNDDDDTNPLTDSELNIIEANVLKVACLDQANALRLISEIRRQRAILAEIDAAGNIRSSTRRVEAGLDRVAGQNAELLEALQYLDAIIDAYQQPGLGSLLITIRLAKEWRGVETAQDAPGATQ